LAGAVKDPGQRALRFAIAATLFLSIPALLPAQATGGHLRESSLLAEPRTNNDPNSLQPQPEKAALSRARSGAEDELNVALRQLETAVANVARQDLPGILAELERIRAGAWLRLTFPPAQEADADRLVGASEAASMVGVEVTALYRKQWPFRIAVSPGRIRYSLRGIERFIRARQR
jgi:hypothetical protein